MPKFDVAELKMTKHGADKYTVATGTVCWRGPPLSQYRVDPGKDPEGEDLPPGRPFSVSRWRTVGRTVLADLHFDTSIETTPQWHDQVFEPDSRIVTVQMRFDDGTGPEPLQIRLICWTHLSLVAFVHHAVHHVAHTATVMLAAIIDLLAYPFRSFKSAGTKQLDSATPPAKSRVNAERTDSKATV
jgi:hypothetical protein